VALAQLWELVWTCRLTVCIRLEREFSG
jgi:hypothetical protein